MSIFECYFRWILPLFEIGFPDFPWLCFHRSGWKLVASFHMKSYRSSLFLSRLPTFSISYCPMFKIGFADFSWLSFHISK